MNNIEFFANLIEKRQTSLFPGNCREIRKNFHQKFAENKNARFDEKNENKNQKFNIQSRKNVGDF